MTIPLRTVLLAVSVSASTTVRAQARNDPPVGERVQLTTADGVRVVGRVTSVTGDTIRLRVGARVRDTMALLLGRFATYAPSVGHDRVQGAGYGVLVGATAGAAVLFVARRADRRERGDVFVSNTTLAAPAAVLLTALGAGLGALVAPERWGPPVLLRVGIRPAGGPLRGLGWTARF